MISKCLWKMYQKPTVELDETDKITKPKVEELVQALEVAIEVVCKVPKSRNSDPILEPHYKIVSIIHKLVMRGDVSPSEAVEILSRQPFGVGASEDDPVQSLDDWEEYIIKNLCALKDKDKSNWQHRIIMRHARILFYDENGHIRGLINALAALGVLRESMFTKTMVMNVWKCEAERAGRHHVYTEQYVRFAVEVLMYTTERENLEALLRRIRKKGADFYHFNDLWMSCCMNYLRLLRASFDVQPTLDDPFKSVSLEEFEIIADRIMEWIASAGTTGNSTFSCMKEASELKKLNGNLMRSSAIDELVTDAYAKLYFDVGRTLPGQDVSQMLEERAAAREAAHADGASESKQSNPFSSILNPPSRADTPNTNGETGDRPAAHEAAPRRKAGVKKADVLKKAEAAVLRAAEAPKSAGGLTSKSRLGSMSSGKNGSNTPVDPAEHVSENGDEEGGEDTEMRDEEPADGEDGAHEDQEHENEHEADEMGEGNGDDGGLSTAPGSVHDSADDESDLSDVPDDYDEETPPGLMFPNLTRSTVAPETPAESDDEEDSGEGEEAEEDEEEGDGDEDEAEEDEDDEEGTEGATAGEAEE
jgi:hypothetical protein